MSTFCVIMASFFIPSEVGGGGGGVGRGQVPHCGGFYLVTFVFLLEYNFTLIHAFIIPFSGFLCRF